MVISLKVLQTFFDDTLPDASAIADALTMKSFEVESVQTIGEDTVMDIDVLPNRASDCLSHLGIAREVSVLFDIPLNVSNETPKIEELRPEDISVIIEKGVADRFVALELSGFDNGEESPKWLVEALKTLGERSISPVVDITNYVLLYVGQPLHAYDLDKLEKLIKGPPSFYVGLSKKGEEFESLGGIKYKLSGNELTVRTKKGTDGVPIGLAGLKGGLSTAVDAGTKRIILEAACFDPILIRKSAQNVKLHTTASKRFENGIPVDLSALGISTAVELLGEIFPELKVHALRDDYPLKLKQEKIELDKTHASRLIGIEISHEQEKTILESLNCLVTEKDGSFLVTPPWYRLDLHLPVNLIEEIGRLYDYKNVLAVPLPALHVEESPTYKAREALRDALVSFGYSEVNTRVFCTEGHVELENPFAKNAPFLRSDLIGTTSEALTLNAQNAELLELEYVRVFEIGSIFSRSGEGVHLVLGIQKTKNAHEKIQLKQEIKTIEEDLIKNLGINLASFVTKEKEGTNELIVEYDLRAIESKLTKQVNWNFKESTFNYYEPFSIYPYVLRDIAVWTPSGTEPGDVESIIREELREELRVVSLFDQFEKEVEKIKKVSYAFRLVFQSFERTLTDEEVSAQMMALEKALKRIKGFEVR